MRPVPPSFLITLLLALCALCAWQWHRESGQRGVASRQQNALTQLQARHGEVEARVKAADAEILRLTGALHELRANSVAKPRHEEVAQANARMREAMEKQSALLIQANAAIQQANENIRTLATERDALAKRVNEITALYNKLANPP
jgi:DNA repair exonuclease SbcCD ATPase subunit